MVKSPTDLHATIERQFPDNEAAKITPEVTRSLLHDLVDADQRGPNYRPSGSLSVIYLTKAEADRTGRPYATLDQLDPTYFYNGMECRVDLHPEGFGVVLQLVYDNRADPRAGILGYIDGNLVLYPQGQVNGKNPLRWVRKDSPEALTANVALYKAGTNYRENDLVRWLFGGFVGGVDMRKSVVFYANESGPGIPAPSRPEGDAYWTVFNPTPAAYQAWQTVTPAALRQLQATNKLSPGRLYIITPRLIPDDPSDNSYPDVFIRALLESVLEPTGYLLEPTGERPLVNYDLATDTTTPVVVSVDAYTKAESDGQRQAIYDLVQQKANPDRGTTIWRGKQVLGTYSSLAEAFALAQAGDTVVVSGYHDYVRSVFAISRPIKLVLAAGSEVIMGKLFIDSFATSDQNGELLICGSGTLLGHIGIGPQSCHTVTMRGVSVRGMVEAYAYNSNNTLLNLTLDKCQLEDQETAVTLQTSYGTYYARRVALKLHRCTLSGSGAIVRAYDGLGSNGEVNSLEAIGNTFVGTSANAVALRIENTVLAVSVAGNTYQGVGRIANATQLLTDTVPGNGSPSGGVTSVNNIPPDANGNVNVTVAPASPAAIPAGSGSAVTFEKERHWPVVSSGTYTVSAAGAVVDVCLQLVLALGSSAIAIPTTGFVKMTATQFDAAKENTYSFCVRVDGQVQYYINQPQ